MVTAYDRDINKTSKTRHKKNEPCLKETQNVNLNSSNVLDRGYVCVTPSLIVFPFPRATKEIGDVCTQAIS